MKETKKKILLIGTHGQQNWGDELLLRVFLYKLKNNNVFFVNSYTPKKTSEEFNVESFHTRKDKLKLIRYIFKADIVLFAGGSIIKEMYHGYGRKTHSVLKMLLLLTWFSKYIAFRKIIFSNIGIGPISQKSSFKYAKAILQTGSIISVRDNESLKYALELKKKSSTIIKVPDAVFAFSREYFGLSNVSDRRINNIHKIKKIGLNLYFCIANPQNWEYYISNLTKTICRLYKENPHIKITGVPMQVSFIPKHDKELLENFKNNICKKLPGLKFNITIPENINHLAQIIDQLDILLATRLHLLIMATIIGTPFISMEHDIKVTAFLKDSTLENSGIKINEKFSENDLFEKINYVCQNYSSIKETLKINYQKNNKQVKEYFEVLKKYMI